jgi:hypothetical protein
MLLYYECLYELTYAIKIEFRHGYEDEERSELTN